MQIFQAVADFPSSLRARWNFRWQPNMCTTLRRTPMQVPKFGGIFWRNFDFELFLCPYYTWFLSTFPMLWCKKVQMTKKSNQSGWGGEEGAGGGGGTALTTFLTNRHFYQCQDNQPGKLNIFSLRKKGNNTNKRTKEKEREKITGHQSGKCKSIFLTWTKIVRLLFARLRTSTSRWFAAFTESR